MNCGIIGLPNVGKTALFNLITENAARSSNYPYCTVEPNKGIAYFRDPRIDKLEEIFKTGKKSYPFLKVTDVAGLPPGASKGEGLGNRFLANIRDAYALLHVVRDFSSPNVARFEKGESDPRRDLELVETELFLADMEIARRRLKENPDSAYWKETLDKLEKQQRPDADEEGVLLSAKPQIILVNITTGRKNPAIGGRNVIYSDIKFQKELSAMDREEREEFKEMAAEWESSVDKIIFKIREMLGLVTFFTVAGGSEAKGYNIQKGSSAYDAAGKVHSDMQDSFIKSKVYNFSCLKESGYNPASLKEAGGVRLEGRDYIIKDGDIIEIMFGNR